MIDLDYSAARRPSTCVRQAVLDALDMAWGHPGSRHERGVAAAAVVDEARQQVASLLGAAAPDVVLTTSGSQANRLALDVALRWGRLRGRSRVVASPIEHPSLRDALLRLQAEGHCEVTWLVLGERAQFSSDQLGEVLADDVCLVTIVAAQHETGLMPQVAKLASVARANGALFHSDCVQSLAHTRVSPQALGVDLASVSGRKIGAGPGCGALWVRDDLALPATHDPELERGLTDPFSNPIAAAALAAASARHLGLDLEGLWAKAARLRDRLEHNLMDLVPGAVCNAASFERLPHVSSMCFPGAEAVALVRRLNAVGVLASTGAACTTYRLEPSYGLLAQGLGSLAAQHSVRFSLPPETDEPLIDRAGCLIADAVAHVRKLVG